MKRELSIVSNQAILGQNVQIYDFVNIYGHARIGDECVIGAFVEIQPHVTIGAKVKISSHTFICTGVTVEDEVFIGHGVMFTNDKIPKSVDRFGRPITAKDTKIVPTLIKHRAVIGSGATILCGITIGEGALVGAGSVVTRDVPPYMIVCGNPAKVLRKVKKDDIQAH